MRRTGGEGAVARKTTKDPVKAAAAKVAAPAEATTRPSKRVVTLYLNEANYLRLQQLQGRQVGKVIDELIAAYLEARGE